MLKKCKQRYTKAKLCIDAISSLLYVICKDNCLKKVTHFQNQVVCFYLGYKKRRQLKLFFCTSGKIGNGSLESAEFKFCALSRNKQECLI